jgi:DnaJ-class molecular chaperone
VSRSPTATVGDDHWAVLGLSPGADAAELKRGFRAQARRWHPDLNGNDPVAEERFKRVNEAYAVLSDPRRRQAWESGLDPGSLRDERTDPFATGFPEFDDYLDALFGRQGRPDDRRPSEPGPEPDRPASTQRPQSAQRSPAAQPRQDPGVEVTHAPPPPPPVQAASDLETLVELSPEQALEGTRLELELPGGLAVELWTPPLAGDGWRLRLAGVAPGGADHFLQLRVRRPDGLRIDGLRVLYDLELSPAEAALGCKVVVPTLEGRVQLTVPPCSSSGRLLRLRGLGLSQGERRGDQLVELRIVLPEQLSDSEVALYRRLEELSGDG